MHADLPNAPFRTLIADASSLRADPLGAFLALELQPREMVLEPILPTQGLAMLYSWRGVGKTHVALGIAYAVASGGSFLRWRAPKQRRVLYVDGEMPGHVMQERVATLVKADGGAPTGNLFLVSGDRQEPGAMPNLSKRAGQRKIDEWIARERIELVVIDNVATLCHLAQDNEAGSWLPMQSWLLTLRRRGVSVLLVHHAGKSGAQRGTSTREDVLDTSIRLVRPADYQPSEGCRLEVHYEKARGLFGKDAEPFEARLELRDGRPAWTIRDIEDANLARARELYAGGASVRGIAEEIGVSRSVAHRLKQRVAAEETGRSHRADA
jgi:putative DNA primase/helicase